MAKPSLAPHQLEELQRVFDIFDRDHSGGISRQEFKDALKAVNFHGPKPLDQEINEIMSEADTDRNLVVDFDEFCAAASCMSCAKGIPTDTFNTAVRWVARVYVGRRDNKSLSYLANYKFWPPPLFSILITLLQIAAFIYYDQKTCVNGLECPESWTSDFAFRPACKREAWRFLTYIFIHAGWQHIFFNMIIQCIMGLPLEMIHGPFRVMAVYILGAIAGSLSSSVFDPVTNLVGASGADYALIGAHIADMIINWSEMEFAWVKAVFFTILIGVDWGTALYARYVQHQASQVSWAAHLAGLVVGITLGTDFLKNLQVKRYEVVLRYVGAAIFISGCISALFVNIFKSYDYHIPYDCAT